MTRGAPHSRIAHGLRTRDLLESGPPFSLLDLEVIDSPVWVVRSVDELLDARWRTTCWLDPRSTENAR